MKHDKQLLSLATVYKASVDARARNMIRGKAHRLISRSYQVFSNREAVWAEWCHLADPDGWLSQ